MLSTSVRYDFHVNKEENLQGVLVSGNLQAAHPWDDDQNSPCPGACPMPCRTLSEAVVTPNPLSSEPRPRDVPAGKLTLTLDRKAAGSFVDQPMVQQLGDNYTPLSATRHRAACSFPAPGTVWDRVFHPTICTLAAPLCPSVVK